MPLLRPITTFLILVVATVLAGSPVALAQSQTPSKQDKAQAAEAFLAGQSLFKKGAYLEAAASFERAFHLAPHPAVLANIGYCYDAAGDYPRAVEFFREYLKQPNKENSESNAEIARYLKKKESKVGDLHVNCFQARCEVKVDSVSRGMAPTTLVLLAGPHVVDVTAVDGDQVRHYEVNILGRGKVVLDVDVSTQVSQSAPAPVSRPVEPAVSPVDTTVRHVGTTVRPVDTTLQSHEQAPRLRPPFWIATAFTVAGAAAVAVLGGVAYSVRADYQAGGSTDVDKKKQGENLVVGTNIAIGVTAVAATTALILAILDLRRDVKKDGNRSEAALRPTFDVHLNGGAFVGMSIDFR